MRILFINRMAGMVRGGGETYDLEMARHLDALGCRTHFLVGRPLWGGAGVPLDHPRVYQVRSPYTGWFPWDRVWQGWRLRVWDFRRFETRAADWAVEHQHKFDVIQICEMPPLVDDLRQRGWKKPVCMRITAPDYHDPNGAVSRADAIMASGTSMAMLQAGPRPDAVNIPNGVDVDHFHPHASPLRDQHGLSPEHFVVLLAGRFQVVKNHRMLIKAFTTLHRTVPHARLVLVGSGPLQTDIQKQVSRAGLEHKVLFLGEVPYREMQDVYAMADVKVITSFHESFSFAALEAMATGLPLVVTRTEWIPRLIEEDRGGMVVPNDDAEAFASALHELYRDPDLRARMGAWNRETVVNHYRWENSAKKLKALYEELLQKKRASRTA